MTQQIKLTCSYCGIGWGPLIAGANPAVAHPIVFRRIEVLPEDRQYEIDRLFGLNNAESSIVDVDKQQQISKRATLPDGWLVGVRSAGEALVQAWLRDVMADDCQPVSGRRSLTTRTEIT
jgi:hypothetical protein